MNGRREDIALWRHYEAAAECAASVLAISRCHLTDREPAFKFYLRQRLQLIDRLYAFAYNARRAIELANDRDSEALAHAKAISLRPYGKTEVRLEIMEDAHPLTDQSLWWVLGRIIHARDLRIHYFEDSEVGTEWAPAPNITEYHTAAAFSVRSDYDGEDERHFVLIDQLLSGYLALQRRFVIAFAALGFPIEEHSLYL